MCKNTIEQQINQLYYISTLHEDSSLVELIKSIYNNGIIGQEKLLNFLIQRYTNNNDTIIFWIDEQIFNLLLKSPFLVITNKLKEKLPYGLINLKSESYINYKPLQNLLKNSKFQEANQCTQKLLYQLSQQSNNHSRYWLYFSDIYLLPPQDLKVIDKLWVIYSQGRFGLSTQKNIWLNTQKNWSQFYETVGWINTNNSYRNYPEEFIWNKSAPTGHLPLLNQIRGHHTLEVLFKHLI